MKISARERTKKFLGIRSRSLAWFTLGDHDAEHHQQAIANAKALDAALGDDFVDTKSHRLYSSGPYRKLIRASGLDVDHPFMLYHRPTKRYVLIAQPYGNIRHARGHVPRYTDPEFIRLPGESVSQTEYMVWDLPKSRSSWNPGNCAVRLIAEYDLMKGVLEPQLAHLGHLWPRGRK